MQLKKENLAELQNARKIMTRAYMFAYVSWLLFVVIFFKTFVVNVDNVKVSLL